MFHVGQRVVCVDDRPYHPLQRTLVQQWPVRGRTYTIRGVKRIGAVVLEEVVNLPLVFNGVGEEPHFHRKRFRPVQERSAGMEILDGILRGGDPSGPEEPARSPQREEVGG